MNEPKYIVYRADCGFGVYNSDDGRVLHSQDPKAASEAAKEAWSEVLGMDLVHYEFWPALSYVARLEMELCAVSESNKRLAGYLREHCQAESIIEQTAGDTAITEIQRLKRELDAAKGSDQGGAAAPPCRDDAKVWPLSEGDQRRVIRNAVWLLRCPRIGKHVTVWSIIKHLTQHGSGFSIAIAKACHMNPDSTDTQTDSNLLNKT